VTYTATDPAGNSTTCSFNVIVKDTSAPAISGCPPDVSIATATCDAVVSWNIPTVTDNCTATISGSHQPGSSFAPGVTTVTYTAVDDAGNTTTCNFTVTVTTNERPSVTGCPEDIIVHTFDEKVEVTWEAPQAIAVCGNLSTISSADPGAQFGSGITEVTYEFSDGTGNKSICKFNITVIRDELIFEISKAITPNGDGVNDTWWVTNIEKFTNNTVTVVDRWGNKVYQSTGYNNSDVQWNGLGLSGTRIPVGTYFYTLEIVVHDEVIRRKGFVEVIY
jgi:gliding motility-associated-like protein